MSGEEGKIIKQKCNQKCIDLFNKKIKVKKEIPSEQTGSHSQEEKLQEQSQEEQSQEEQSQ